VSVRNAQHEANERVGGRYDVRVLEPSPPSVNEPPFFADDPVAGGDVLPIERSGARTWAEICNAEDDAELRAWCADRWLVPHSLTPLPATFAATRVALHAVAERDIAPARQAVTGKIGLRFTYHGFGTPFFGDDRQVRVEDGVLIDGETRSDLGVDPAAARALGDWYGYCALLLEQLRADASAEDTPSRVQLWPEHFDIAVDLGPGPARANYGASPGDAEHDEPYLYVGPRAGRGNESYWNETFGASLSYSALLAGADGLAFLRRGKELLCRTSG
jgi:hypothetical protein